MSNLFRVKNGLSLTPVDLTTLTNPQAGDLACDINDSNKIKRYDAVSSSWTEVGSGAAGDVDTLLVQDFESATLASFTQTGLELIIVNPIDGKQSARLVHQAGSTRSFKQTIAVPPKYRGVNMTASLVLRSSASQGNVTIQFRDETNSIDYPSQQLQTNSQAIASLVTNSTTTVSGFSNSVINTLKVGMTVTGSGIPTGTTIASINSTALTITLSQAATASATVSLRFSDLPRTLQLGFNIPANCLSYSYTISALQESGSPETYIDDIVLKNYWLGMSNHGQSGIQVDKITQQNIQLSAGSSTVSATITNFTVDSNTSTGLLSYSSGSITALKKCSINSFVTGRNNAAAVAGIEIRKNAVLKSKDNTTNITYMMGTGFSDILEIGDVITVASEGNVNLINFGITAQIVETSTIVVNDLVPAKAVLGNTSLDIPNVTGWQGYTPTFQGFGTPTNVEFEYRQVGEDVEIRGKFQSGAPTAVEARVGLPAGLSSAGTSLVPSIQVVGKYGATSSMPNSPNGSGSMLAEPSVAYITFSGESTGGLGITKQTGSQLTTNGNYISFFAKVPCAGLSATEQVVVSGTQSALVQEDDSTIMAVGAVSFGSTNTTVVNFPTIRTSIGSNIVYSSSAAAGTSFTVLKTGTYSISAFLGSAVSATTQDVGITKNSPSLSTAVSGIADDYILMFGRDTVNTASATTKVPTVSWTGILQANDVIRIQGTAATTPNSGSCTVTYQGSLKQLNVSSDQKITIPTSELRFEGAGARGTGSEAGIVQFTSLSKIKGDAFTIVSDSTNGTAITMIKSGKLSIAASLVNSAAQSFQITKNQSIRTSISSVSSEVLSTVSNATGIFVALAADTYVNIGDVIRVAGNATPTANATNNLNLTFQEQDISVSVTNTLPQFSDSDSSVRVDTANGYGSTNTTVRRFSSVLDNIGSDIQYTDDVANGASFTARTAGIYHVTYLDSTTASTDSAVINITKNSTSNNAGVVAQSDDRINTASGLTRRLTASWSGYLVAGDIIRAVVGSAAAVTSGAGTQLTISKVGKPNVTGVNVTPFINVPQPDSQSARMEGASSRGSTATAIVVYNSLVANTNTGLFRIDSDAVLGTRITALKNCTMSVDAGVFVSGTGYTAQITKNQATLTTLGLISEVLSSDGAGTVGGNAAMSWTGPLTAGDVVRVVSGSALTANAGSVLNVYATSTSDTILTVPSTFSTDTAALAYSSTYTLTTLSDAPVGTYITFTYAINTYTRTQTSTRPTQTDADMNANGVLVYTRAYNAASTAAQPSTIAIQIGKGLKGLNLGLYKSSGKSTSGNVDAAILSTATQYGLTYKDYNEVTGILFLDAGAPILTTITSNLFSFSDVTTATSGYLVINASKNPALTGLGLNRIAARYVSSAGGSIGTSLTLQTLATKDYDTNGAFNGTTFTCPETGYYQINTALGTAGVLLSATQSFNLQLYVNGVAKSSTTTRGNGSTSAFYCNLSDTYFLKIGDTVQVYASADVATTQQTTAQSNFFSITKVSV